MVLPLWKTIHVHLFLTVLARKSSDWIDSISCVEDSNHPEIDPLHPISEDKFELASSFRGSFKEDNSGIEAPIDVKKNHIGVYMKQYSRPKFLAVFNNSNI